MFDNNNISHTKLSYQLKTFLVPLQKMRDLPTHKTVGRYTKMYREFVYYYYFLIPNQICSSSSSARNKKILRGLNYCLCEKRVQANKPCNSKISSILFF